MSAKSTPTEPFGPTTRWRLRPPVALRQRPRRPVAYSAAVLLVGAALLIRLVLKAALGNEAPYLPFIAAVIGAAWYGGLGPGLLATVLAGTISTALFLEPEYSLSWNGAHKLLWWLLFLAIGGLVSWLHESLHQALSRAEAALQERQQAEERLLQSETRFRKAIEAAPVPIMLHAADGSVLTVNRTWRDLNGYTTEQLPTVAAWIERAGGDPERNREALRRVFSAGEPRLELGEFVVRDAQGRELTWDLSAALLDQLPDGQPLAISMAKDVTARQHAERELVRLNAAVEAAANGIAIVDRAGVFLWVNPSFARMTGYARGEVVGQHTRLLKSGVQDRKFYRELWATVTAGRVWRGVLCNRRKDGSHYHEEMTITPVLDGQGKVQYFVAIKEDITDKQHLQTQLQQSQKLEAIGRLAGGVAHDFNNLITVISGFSELLLAILPAGDPKREMVKAVADAGARAAGLTRQLLAFSRQTVVEPRVLDLNAVVRDTEKMLRRLIGEDVLLTTLLDPLLLPVKVDAAQMGQVLMNLAVNARDAMPRGGKLTIETANVELDAAYAQAHEGVRPGCYALLAMTDTGTGMPPEVQARIFEPFFTTKPAGHGTGLGLAVVLGIVQQCGGRIEVYSEVGVGTTLKIYLPVATEEAAADAAAAPAPPLHGSETVCLVEDEDSVREMARVIFETHGYRVLAANGGEAALRLFEQHGQDIQVLLTDVVMPGMSGREVADALTARFPRLKVVFTSGYTDDAVVRHGILQADVAFVQKPYTPSSLLRKVRQVLDQSGSHPGVQRAPAARG